MNTIKNGEYKFNIDFIREGQPRRYADSEYEYVVTSDCGEFSTKAFCTNVLKPNKQAYKDWNRDSADSYFAGYYMFEKTGENTYRYYVREPFCD